MEGSTGATPRLRVLDRDRSTYPKVAAVGALRAHEAAEAPGIGAVGAGDRKAKESLWAPVPGDKPVVNRCHSPTRLMSGRRPQRLVVGSPCEAGGRARLRRFREVAAVPGRRRSRASWGRGLGSRSCISTASTTARTGTLLRDHGSRASALARHRREVSERRRRRQRPGSTSTSPFRPGGQRLGRLPEVSSLQQLGERPGDGG